MQPFHPDPSNLLGLYTLDGHTPVPCKSLMEWAQWNERARCGGTEDLCRVAGDFADVAGEIWVSTVFLGIDHNWSMHGPPLLFETMAFIGGESTTCRRYATWAEAEAGHAIILQEGRAFAALAEFTSTDAIVDAMRKVRHG
jgi:hypothetical protein